MSESLKHSFIKQTIKGCIVTRCLAGKDGPTNVELMKAFKHHSKKEWPFVGFGPSFDQMMEDCGCVAINGRWIIKKVNRNTANLLMGSSNQNGRRQLDYTVIENAETDKRGKDGPNDRPECSFIENRLENDRVDKGGHAHTPNEFPTSSHIHDGERSRQRIDDDLSPDGDSNDDEDYVPPGLTPGSGYRPTATNPTQKHSSTLHYGRSTDILTQQSSGATFHFPPPKIGKVNSSLLVEIDTPDGISYEELCPVATDIFISSWPSFMNADELMNSLARKTKLPSLVGPNQMIYHENIIDMITKKEGSLYVKTIDEEKVYSYIPGLPEASDESNLFEQVGKMLCLILNTYGDMTIESAQLILGFPDNSQFTTLNGYALIMEVSQRNANIIVGPSIAGHGRDRKLSLRFGASVENLRSQVFISRRCTTFSQDSDKSVVHRDAGLSQADKSRKLLTECENYISDDFALFNEHPMVESGPEVGIEWYKGTMVYYSSLDKFTIRTDNDVDNYKVVQSNLQTHYGGIEWNDIFLNYIKEGAAVAVKMENGTFARGVVTHYNRNPSEASFVYLVDEGCLDEVPINNIFPLKDSMKGLFPLGIRCTISAFRTNPAKLEKFFDEHRAIWNTLHRESYVEMHPAAVVACGGKKELVVELKFKFEDEDYHYPHDLVDNKIITLL